MPVGSGLGPRHNQTRSLSRRDEPFREGECGTGWLLLFHLLPLHRHTIHLASLDVQAMTLRSLEHGGCFAPGTTRCTSSQPMTSGAVTATLCRSMPGR